MVGEHKEIYVVESRREDSREKRNHWEGQGARRGKQERGTS